MTDLDVLDRAIKQEVAGEAVLRPLRLGILLDPADDLARLAYADALEELGRTVEASRIRARLASPEVCEEAEACGVRTVESRGFVRSASCTLQTFLREAGRLFAYYPITEVTLADKEPYRLGGPDRPAGWFWAKVSGGSLPKTRPHWMPGEVLDDPVWKAAPRVWSTSPVYEGREQAMAAMSLALTNYGRSLAGLPPLPPRA